MEIPLGSRPRPSRAPWLIVVVMMLLVAGGVLFIGLRAGGKPTIELTADGVGVGRSKDIQIVAREPVRGLVSLTVALHQPGKSITLAEETFAPQPAWLPGGAMTGEKVLAFKIGKDHQAELVEGPLTIEIVAQGAGTWMNAAQMETERRTLQVRLTPPALAVTAREIYVTQGGTEVVTYTVGPTSVRDGVVAGRWFFTGYPRPGGDKADRIALFAVPYDMSNGDDVKLIAEDDVGNRSETAFIDSFKAKPYNTDTIEVSKRFMRAVVPKIRAKNPSLPDKGELVANYIVINRDLREQNNKRLEELASRTKPEFLWSEPFVQMPAKVVSSFADRRTYLHQGKEIDKQDHLGFDLASFRRAEIPAANDGIVVMAEYLGIYGNTIVIDHGMGLMSLYGHCSSVAVKVGDEVKRSQVIGRTGATGLALGDHLHFTMLLAGLPVTPLEWWDGHWIQDRIKRKLPGVFAAKD